jgi:hypothetical protein
MEYIFQSVPKSFINRVLRVFSVPLIVIWIVWLLIFFIIPKDNHIKPTVIVFIAISLFACALTIPKLRYFLISISFENNAFRIDYLDFNKINQIQLSIDDLDIESKYAWTKGPTVILLFFNKGKHLFKIFAYKQCRNYTNESFEALYNNLRILKAKKKGSAQQRV